MKDAMAFLQALQNDPRAKELIRDMKIPEDREKASECYVSLASKLGYTLTKEEIMSAARELSKAQREQTGRTLAKVSLNDDELENVAGGVDEPGHEGCDSSYHDHEWCWWSDSCNMIISFYQDVFYEVEFDVDDILKGDHCTQIPRLED